MGDTKIIYDKYWYLPTSLVDKSGRATLLVHHYTMRRGQTITLTNKMDALEFQNEAEMVGHIQSKRLSALPEEADGNPQYVPKRVLTLKRKYQGQL